MYKVVLLQDGPRRRKLCEACAVDPYPLYPAYVIETEKGDVGIIPFYLEGRVGVIPEIGVKETALAEDFEPFFVAGRQTLNLLNLCGASYAELLVEKMDQQQLVRTIGFQEKKGRLCMDLDGAFTGHCDS